MTPEQEAEVSEIRESLRQASAAGDDQFSDFDWNRYCADVQPLLTIIDEQKKDAVLGKVVREHWYVIGDALNKVLCDPATPHSEIYRNAMAALVDAKVGAA